MGSIYGNRDRKDNSQVTRNASVSRDVSKGSRYNRAYTNSNRGNPRVAKKQDNNTKQNQLPKIFENIRFRRFVVSLIINLIITAIFVIASVIMISGEYREIYIKLLFLPLASFVAGFVTKFVNKDGLMNIAGTIAIQFIAFLIFVDFSFIVFLWLLFYLVNTLIGAFIATVARTFRDY